MAAPSRTTTKPGVRTRSRCLSALDVGRALDSDSDDPTKKIPAKLHAVEDDNSIEEVSATAGTKRAQPSTVSYAPPSS
jgi:hypothetical protein